LKIGLFSPKQVGDTAHHNDMKTALITGASSGIGWATALLLSKQGFRLVICGRRQNKLQALSEALETPHQILTFDVRKRQEVFDAIERLEAPFNTIDLLVNNAGNAHGLDPAHEASLDDWEAMIDGNVKWLLYVTKALLPQMIARKNGQIINVGSIAGKEAYPKGNVYCASKAAVDRFTEGLRLDCNPFGIRVGAIHPGLVATEFSEVRFKGDQPRAASVYAKLQALTAADVAQAIAYMVAAPAHVTIADLTILPTDQASAYVVNRNT